MLYIFAFITYYLAKKKRGSNWVSIALSNMTSLILGFLLIPIMSTLISMLDCNSSGNMVAQPNVKCWTYSHTALIAIGIFFSILLAFYIIIAALIFFSSYGKSLTTRRFSPIITLECILRVFLGILCVIKVDPEIKKWIFGISISICYFGFLYSNLTKHIFFDNNANFVFFSLIILL